ncbi:hypothetical protein [Methylobacterium nigriterrae]|uniref:hypothetical protein n=1 Tax=Methylobacterium nigriterrae TaxID=3127512 RepID=UPI003013700B
MSPLEMETCIKFFMERLSEDELAELDARMTSGVPVEPAMDSALKRRRGMLAMDAKTRVSIRKALASNATNEAKDRQALAEFLPNMNRLKVG